MFLPEDVWYYTILNRTQCSSTNQVTQMRVNVIFLYNIGT